MRLLLPTRTHLVSRKHNTNKIVQQGLKEREMGPQETAGKDTPTCLLHAANLKHVLLVEACTGMLSAGLSQCTKESQKSCPRALLLIAGPGI